LASRSANLRAQIDPLGAAQLKMNAAIANAGQLLEAGAVSEGEHAAAVGLALRAYADAEAELKRFAQSGGLGTGQMMALTAAIRHMIDATIAGRPPLQAMAMEVGNLSYGLSGSGGLMGALRGTVAGIGSMIGVTGAVVAAVAAIAV